MSPSLLVLFLLVLLVANTLCSLPLCIPFVFAESETTPTIVPDHLLKRLRILR